MSVVDILRHLISFPSVVGTPNGDIAGWIADYLNDYGIASTRLPGPEGDRVNLFATIGPKDEAGYIVSGHMDVVPAGEAEWASDPFQLSEADGRLLGRGTSDMKGFLAAALAAVPALMAIDLRKPIHFAFSYDEEAGCRGVPHLLVHLPTLCAPPLGAIIGEPSNLQAVRAHKGKAAARVVLTGRTGHSSRPDLGLNAIHAMTQVLTAASTAAQALTQGPFDKAFEPAYSSLQVGVITGGQAVNIIPDRCAAELEARAISGVDPRSLLAPVKVAAEQLAAQGFGVEWSEMSAYPALSLAADAPLVTLLEDLTEKKTLAAVSYGTEAGLFQAAGVPSIICGPGDISRAHKPNEFILIDELLACQAMIEALGARCSGI
ncbi:acetylornithine deacetylase [Methylovirgula sp. 4M-Z18]|uniref:acetylornithine deacetylase n=1 Tax=Methylovirgula sp. 4M-Z18 TaxID=2293567 RepID=UPI000E2E4F95|nr:acetylornithine deacetylase [Methylovirgula sp. 4M-Z18]RFB79810.1 acetylornithine deacetylase [Methylovirgula sp. 4M-Z18]